MKSRIRGQMRRESPLLYDIQSSVLVLCGLWRLHKLSLLPKNSATLHPGIFWRTLQLLKSRGVRIRNFCWCAGVCCSGGVLWPTPHLLVSPCSAALCDSHAFPLPSPRLLAALPLEGLGTVLGQAEFSELLLSVFSRLLLGVSKWWWWLGFFVAFFRFLGFYDLTILSWIISFLNSRGHL